MKQVVVLAHPNLASFNAEVARVYVQATRKRGHEVILRDLYRMDFDPRLQAGELPQIEGFAPAADVIVEREMLRDAEALVLVYPLWFYAPPAMIKGYIERVLGMGFGFGGIRGGGNAPLLRGKSLLSFTSSGSPTQWVEAEGAWEAIRTLFDRHLTEVCGLTLLDHVHFGGVVMGMRADAVAGHLARVRETVARFF